MRSFIIELRQPPNAKFRGHRFSGTAHSATKLVGCYYYLLYFGNRRRKFAYEIFDGELKEASS